MKPTSHDPLDDLIAAALHGELTPAERARLDAQIANDPAVRTAYQEALAMHDLLEKTHATAQPDATFEQRMVSGVRRKITETKRPREGAWQSVVILWTTLNKIFGKRAAWQYATACVVVLVGAFSFLIVTGNQVKSVFTTISSQLSAAQTAGDEELPMQKAQDAAQAQIADANMQNNAIRQAPTGGDHGVLKDGNGTLILSRNNTYQGQTAVTSGALFVNGATAGRGSYNVVPANQRDLKKVIQQQGINYTETAQKGVTMSGYVDSSYTHQFGGKTTQFGKTLVASDSDSAPIMAPRAMPAADLDQLESAQSKVEAAAPATAYNAPDVTTTPQGGTIRGQGFTPPGAAMASEQQQAADQLQASLTHATPATVPVSAVTSTTEAAPAAIDTRKLIRNAQLDLEVKSFQSAMDQITALTRAAGGYVDSDNSQRGGNGKIQGTVVVKVLPQNFDDFLVKLRDVGDLKNQTISTDDVTKEYVDLQARVDNSQRMEAQLQELLKRDYGKISDLLQVERELARVRGDIEQMQGQLKLYDFQVAYATVTMQVSEKDLNQAAAYLLKEQDNFSILATDVETAFKQARGAADDCKGQVLTANLNHNSGSDVSAQLDVMVPPDQIETFLAQIRNVGRVSNFTRQTQRVARDGGDSNQPADQALTEKDKVEVQIAINSDAGSHKQAALTVVTTAVDDALDKAKAAALAQEGSEILSSSLNKTQDGQSTAQLSVRVPGKGYRALLDAYRALGRSASYSLQRDDNSGPGASGDDEPVVLDLSLTDDETPLQETQLAILGGDIDSQSQQLKQSALDAGAEIKASGFQHQPDGTEIAQMTFRLPMAKYPAFIEVLKKLGKVESLTVNRNDRPDQARADDSAPAQIDLTLHNQGDIVAEDNGLWATLRRTFGEGAGALLGSVRVIGVVIAFTVPWLIALVLVAWIGRRIYVWYKR